MLTAKFITLLVVDSIRGFVHLSISPSVGLLVHQSIHDDQVENWKNKRSLSLSLSLCLSVCLFDCQSVSVCLSVCLSVCVSLSLSLIF